MKRCVILGIILFLTKPICTFAIDVTRENNSISFQGNFATIEFSKQVINAEYFENIEIQNYSLTNEPGKPILPVYTRLVMLPNRGNYTLSKFEYNYTEHIIENNILYSGWEDNCKMDGDFYTNDEWYPQELVSIGSPVIMRGYRFCQMSIAAVQYNPAKRMIRVLNDIDAEFTVDNKNIENPITHSRNKQTSSFYQLLSEHVNGLESKGVVDDGSYLLICPDDCVSTLEPLVSWKRKLGYTINVVPLSEIGSDPSAFAIKYFIQVAYETWDIPPEYVILVGDVSGNYVIPSFYVEGYATQYDVSDHPYSLLEGDDYFPDVHIGRFPIHSLMELHTIVNKIVHYESQITDGDWYNKAIMISGIMSYDEAKSGMYTQYITKMNIRDKLLDFGFDTVDTFTYPYNTGTQQLLTWLDTGYSLLNFRGWGAPFYWDNGEDILYSDDIPSLNNGYMLTMVAGMTCGGGDFAYEGTRRTLGEVWLVAGTPYTPKGAIGFIGPSEHDTRTQFNNCYDMGIFQGITHENLYRCGEMLLRGKMELYMNYPHNHVWGGSEDSDQFYFYIYNLLGDPGLRVWTDIPKNLTIVCDSLIPENQNFIVAHIDSVDEKSGFTVSLTYNDSLISAKVSDETGIVNFYSDFSVGNYDVTISKYGYLPVTKNISVYSDESLEMNNITFIDEPCSGSLVEYEFSLQNVSNLPIENISINLSSDCSELFILTDSIFIDTIDPQEQYTCQNNLLRIDPHWLGDYETNIIVNVHSNTINPVFKIPVEVKSPELVLSKIVVQNNDDSLIQGQENNVFIELTNTGTYQTDFFHVNLICTNDKVTVTQNTSYYTTIHGNGAGTNSVPFSVIPHQVITGESATFKMEVHQNDSLVQNILFSVSIGVMNRTSPTFSEYGYYAIESSDIGNFTAPVYDWIELDPSLGGEGTLVNGVYITSDGYVTTMDLPFELVYFGYFCDEITICSNGWLSLGDDLVYHRNKTIPSGCGPIGMIAPFWDNLKDGKIYVLFDEAEHKFIIQWQEFSNVYNPNVKETFQVILFDPEFYPTVNSNVEILFQYKSVSNIDQNDNYATVGIENFSQTDGVLMTYSNIYPPTAHLLENATAILFTVKECPELALLEVSPNQFHVTLSPDTTITEQITVSNTSTRDLSFSVSTSHYVDKKPVRAGKNIENDFIIASTSYYYTGQPMDIYCYLYHNSPDGEGIQGITMDFPNEVYVNDALSINTLLYNGQTGFGAESKWGYGQGTPIYQSGIHSFSINVMIGDTITCPISIDWLIEGMGTGQSPHFVDGSFTLEPSSDEHLWITYPNGGETFVYSLVDTIRWTTSGDIENVTLYIRTHPSLNWELIVEDIPNIDYYPYAVYNELSDSCEVFIRDADGYATDTSDDFFSINIFDITHPTDGDIVASNTLDTLRWNLTGIYDNVIVELSRDNGCSWELLFDEIPNNGNFEYYVSGPPSDWCKFKIISPDYAIFNTSKGHFQIIDPSVSWLTLGETSGNLKPGESRIILFEIETNGLEPGNYGAYIHITSDIGQKIPILVDLDIAYSIDDTISYIPSIHNAPNPFKHQTTISCYNKKLSNKDSSIFLYNIRGQLIRTITCKAHQNFIEATWDGKDNAGNIISSGIYIYQIRTSNKTITTSKCLLLSD